MSSSNLLQISGVIVTDFGVQIPMQGTFRFEFCVRCDSGMVCYCFWRGSLKRNSNSLFQHSSFNDCLVTNWIYQIGNICGILGEVKCFLLEFPSILFKKQENSSNLNSFANTVNSFLTKVKVAFGNKRLSLSLFWGHGTDKSRIRCFSFLLSFLTQISSWALLVQA